MEFQVNEAQSIEISTSIAKINEISEELRSKDVATQSSPGFAVLTYDATKFKAKTLDIEKLKKEISLPHPVLDKFIAQGGFTKILSATKKILEDEKNLKNMKNKNSWLMYISELEFFEKIPNFLSKFLSQESSLDIMMNIFGNSTKDAKYWEENENHFFTNIYNGVAKSFDEDGTAEIRANIVENGILGKVLDRLAEISKETTRKWTELKEEKVEESKANVIDMDEDKGTGKKKIEKRKGVGYDAGGKKSNWSTKDWLALKEIKNKKIMSLTTIVKNMLQSEDWKPHESILRIFCESCILSLIENALRCSSLLEMAKEKELYMIYLDLALQMSKLEPLVPALLPIDRHYQPN